MADTVKATIRNTHPGPGTHIFTDVACGEVEFKPGEIKTLDISSKALEELRNTASKWELATKGAAKKAEQPAAGGDEKLSKADLQGMTKAELQEHAEDKGVEVSPSMTKDKMVKEIVKGTK